MPLAANVIPSTAGFCLLLGAGKKPALLLLLTLSSPSGPDPEPVGPANESAPESTRNMAPSAAGMQLGWEEDVHLYCRTSEDLFSGTKSPFAIKNGGLKSSIPRDVLPPGP